MKKRWAGVLLAAAGAALIITASVNGEYRDVWRKAIIICMECIGLG